MKTNEIDWLIAWILSQASEVNVGVELNMILVQTLVWMGFQSKGVGSKEHLLPSNTSLICDVRWSCLWALYQMSSLLWCLEIPPRPSLDLLMAICVIAWVGGSPAAWGGICCPGGCADTPLESVGSISSVGPGTAAAHSRLHMPDDFSSEKLRSSGSCRLWSGVLCSINC